MLSTIWIEIFYRPLFNVLIFLYQLLGNNMGLAIIAITLLVRVLLFPLSYKASRSQRMLAELAPQLKELQKKHTDKNEQLRAQLELYQKNKINPLSSCLPTLIQFPVLFALYYSFRDGLVLSHLDRLYSFIHHPAALNSFFLGLDLAKPSLSTPIKSLTWAYWILPLLAGLTQYVFSMMTLPKTKVGEKPAPEQALTRQMAIMFPVMTAFIALRLPSGLSLYWVVTTLFAIGQQIVINNKVKILKEKDEQGS